MGSVASQQSDVRAPQCGLKSALYTGSASLTSLWSADVNILGHESLRAWWVLNKGWAAQWTNTFLMKLRFNWKNSLGTLLTYFLSYFHVPATEWRFGENKDGRVNSHWRVTNFSSTFEIYFLSFLLQNGRAGTLCLMSYAWWQDLWSLWSDFSAHKAESESLRCSCGGTLGSSKD